MVNAWKNLTLDALSRWFIVDNQDNVVIRLFGVTASQNSVCVQVHGFFSYFYVLLENPFEEKDIEYAKKYLNDLVKVNALIPKPFLGFCH